MTSTLDVYPTAVTHPGAIWVRTGNTLTSPDRHPLPCFDDADGFVLGTTEPTWANSGCRIASGSLTVNSTVNLITTADGQVISGLWLTNGRIELRHKNVVVRDCVINVGPPGDKPLIHDNCGITSNPAYDTSGAVISYVTVEPTYTGNDTDARLNGMFVIASTVYRCAIRAVTDAVAPDNNNTFPATCNVPSHVWGNYLETRFLPVDPLQSDGTHNDGVQFAGVDGHTVIGNAIHNPDATSASGVKGQCVVLSPYHVPTIMNVSIISNWLFGSYTQVANWPIWAQGGPGSVGITITGNRHGGTCVWPILLTPVANQSKRALSGNVVAAGGLTYNNGTLAAGATTPVNVAINNVGTGL